MDQNQKRCTSPSGRTTSVAMLAIAKTAGGTANMLRRVSFK